MSSSKAALRSQRRRELDARRSKSRIRLGSSLQGWAQLKDKLGFSLHSQLAQHLLESYVSRVCIKCSGHEKGAISTTMESLQELIMLVHSHGQTCPLPPVLRSGSERDQSAHETAKRAAEIDSSELDVCFKYTCEDRHHFLWSPIRSMKVMTSKKGDTTASSSKKLKQRGRRLMGEPIAHIERPEMVTRLKTRRQHRQNVDVNTEETEQKKEMRSEMFRENKNAGVKVTVTPKTQEGSNVAAETSLSESLADSEEMTGDDPDRVCTENRSPPDSNEEVAVLNLTNRGTQSTADPTEKRNNNKKTGFLKNNSLQSIKNDMSEIGGKRKRKSTSKVILPCEFEGCDKIFSSRQYLNHHVKYQHVQQKTFSCSHPSCNKSFNFKKHLKEHEKLHSNQRDYICEFCARAFRTSSNLIIHRRIHTGEKPLQCEVCGFTCRQKASLNWHMRKHNAESTYQFPCEICGRRFEKRDNVTAHRSKSHPDYNTPTADLALPLPPSDPLLHPSGQRGSFPSTSRNQTAVE